MTYYGTASWFVIQWHGMANTTCQNTDVHLSHGLNVTPAPADTVAVLRDKLLLHNPTWVVSLPGPGSCDLNATKNVQGRLLNGVAPERVCCTAVSQITQRFIHIEQHLSFRIPSQWIAPLIDTFP